jgi:hypothetical protein
MVHQFRISFLAAGLAAFFAASGALAQALQPAPMMKDKAAPIAEKVEGARAASWHGTDLALGGRDVVSFHQSSGPVKGLEDVVAEWDQTKWRFASEENRALFLKHPKKYVPGFGGYCPVALADRKIKVGRSSKHMVVDGTLYLNNDTTSLERFRRGPKEIISQARLHF